MRNVYREERGKTQGFVEFVYIRVHYERIVCILLGQEGSFMKWTKALIIGMVGLLLIGCLASAQASALVRVGFYEDGDYQHRLESGGYAGFNIAYLQEIAKFTQWEYQFVDCASWEQAYAKLAAGEIDILPAVYQSEERRREALFSLLPMCYVYSTLSVRPGELRFRYEDFSAVSKMRVGVIRGGKDAEYFQTYCRENGAQPEIVPYGETKALLKALEDRKLDAVAMTYPGRSSPLQSVARFAVQPMYFAVTRQRPELLAALDGAMQKLRLRDPKYEVALYEKYLSEAAQNAPVFSKDELAYIRSAGKIKVAYAANWAPLEYTDPQTGAFSGMSAELFKRIGEMSGLTFEFSPYADYLPAARAVAEGSGADILCGVSREQEAWSDNALLLTGLYLRAPVVMVRAGRAGDRIAMPRGYVLSRRIVQEHLNQAVFYFDSVEDCFDALARGAADVTYSNTHIANYLLANPRYEGFSVVTLTDYADEIAVGVSKFADPRLYAVLDKCVQAVPGAQMNDWILKNAARTRRVEWRDLFYQHPVEAVGILGAVFFIALTLLLCFVFSKARDHRRIRQLLYSDALTGAWNLSKFRAQAQCCIAEGKQAYALLYADISRFKDVNDLYGFSGGDEVLKHFAQVLAEKTEPDECCARVSADQFVLLLRFSDWPQLCGRTREIGEAVNALPLLRQKGCQLALHFGVYAVREEDRGQDVSALLDAARYAHQSVKETHKSVTVLYDEEMRRADQEQRALAGVMEKALRGGEFVTYFQPKVDMATHAIVGAEALVRWLHPERGLLLPGAFIPFFERNGFIVELDFYMYERVCACIRQWLDAGFAVRPVSCNFSRLHIKNNRFAQQVEEIARRRQVAPSYLELEITESVVMDDPAQALRQFAQLREAGFRISIDDFGAGYSSLGMLQALAADVLKLDRSLLAPGNLEKRRQAIIGGVIAMARSLDMAVVCEGVENEQQADMLMRMGCQVAQSFYYGRPMPQEAFEHLFHADTAGWLREETRERNSCL